MLHGPRLGDQFLQTAKPVAGADAPHLVQFQIGIADQQFDDVRLGLVPAGIEFERDQVGDGHNLERAVFTHDHDHSIKVRYRVFGSSGERVLVSLPALARAAPNSGLPPHTSNAIPGSGPSLPRPKNSSVVRAFGVGAYCEAATQRMPSAPHDSGLAGTKRAAKVTG